MNNIVDTLKQVEQKFYSRDALKNELYVLGFINDHFSYNGIKHKVLTYKGIVEISFEYKDIQILIRNLDIDMHGLRHYTSVKDIEEINQYLIKRIGEV